MPEMRVLAGVVMVSSTLLLILARYVRAPKQRGLSAWGWAGLLLIASAEILLRRGVYWVAVYFTPLAWTGYLLLTDAATRTLRPPSHPGRTPREFFHLAFWSVPLWLVFEAYNLRLQNWTYVGLPANPVLQAIGYVWSFATIWPAILGTADFLEALGCFSSLRRPRRIGPSLLWTLILTGVLCLVLPVLVPVRLGQYLFGGVWVGFVLVLDPLNYWAKGRSLLGDLEAGRTARINNLLASGMVCGILWEFWNYWAAAKWVYVFPIMQGWKIFEMPLLGYLGFAPFALECFVMYEFGGTLRKQISRLLRRNAAFA
ncbi:MAG: hypothetical protein HY508_04745 [Acidobacteria bacterium]|nr:hypothetical protein [Acidobacteriota bacterium]